MTVAQSYKQVTTSMPSKSLVNQLAAGMFCIGMATVSTSGADAAMLQSRPNLQKVSPYERTRQTPSPVSYRSMPDAIAAIRRKTGLSMEDIGDLFDVSRKTAHNWSNGTTPTYENELAVYRVAAIFDSMDGTPEQIRASLGTSIGGGKLVYDLLCERQYQQVADILNISEARRAETPGTSFDSRGKFIPAGYLVETDTPVSVPKQKLKSSRTIVSRRS